MQPAIAYIEDMKMTMCKMSNVRSAQASRHAYTSQMRPFDQFILAVLIVGMLCVRLLAGPATTRGTEDASPTSAPTSKPAQESKDPREQCAAHMRQMILAGLMWSNAHNVDVPPDLNAIFTELQEDIGLDPKMVVCPTDRTVKVPKHWSTLSKADQLAWAVANTSYVYSGAGIDPIKASQAHVADQIIVLTEKIHDHTNRGGGMNVGFVDGHVEFIRKADLPAANARNDAARAKLAH